MSEHDEKKELNRRTFLFQLAAMTASGSLLASCARAGVGTSTAAAATRSATSPDFIGLQLFTVRDQLQADFEGTLAKIAQIGYKNMEFAGYYNRTPEQVRATLDKLNLVSTSSHIGAPLLRQDAAGQIKAAKTIGQDYITIPSYQFGKDLAGWRKGVAEFNQWGAMCRDAGLRLAYHNHNFEFAPLEGTTGYEILQNEVDPKLVDFELDLYWARFAGQDPLALFARHPGRFTMWHVKDMVVADDKKSMSPVGKGTIDFKSYFAHAQQSGLKYFFVEHDSAAQYPGGSLASVEASYQYLHQLLA